MKGTRWRIYFTFIETVGLVGLNSSDNDDNGRHIIVNPSQDFKPNFLGGLDGDLLRGGIYTFGLYGRIRGMAKRKIECGGGERFCCIIRIGSSRVQLHQVQTGRDKVKCDECGESMVHWYAAGGIALACLLIGFEIGMAVSR